MKFRLDRLARRLLAAAAYSAFGGLVVLVVVFIVYMEHQPALYVWHTTELDEEFMASSEVEPRSRTGSSGQRVTPADSDER